MFGCCQTTVVDQERQLSIRLRHHWFPWLGIYHQYLRSCTYINKKKNERMFQESPTTILGIEMTTDKKQQEITRWMNRNIYTKFNIESIGEEVKVKVVEVQNEGEQRLIPAPSIYWKNTATHQDLLAEPYHPIHIIKNILTTIANRCRTNCSDKVEDDNISKEILVEYKALRMRIRTSLCLVSRTLSYYFEEYLTDVADSPCFTEPGVKLDITLTRLDSFMYEVLCFRQCLHPLYNWIYQSSDAVIKQPIEYTYMLWEDECPEVFPHKFHQVSQNFYRINHHKKKCINLLVPQFFHNFP